MQAGQKSPEKSSEVADIKGHWRKFQTDQIYSDNCSQRYAHKQCSNYKSRDSCGSGKEKEKYSIHSSASQEYNHKWVGLYYRMAKKVSV